MKLIKNNLSNLNNNLEIFPSDIKYSHSTGNSNIISKDNKRELIPKNINLNLKPIYKSGNKMRIPGVLDDTGAKYPFKKIKKGQEGLRTNRDNIDRTPKYGIRINDPQSNEFFYNDFVPRLIQTRPDLTEQEISRILEIPITVDPHYGYLFYSIDDDFKNNRLAGITGNPLNDDGSWITQTLMPFYRNIKIVLNPYRDDDVYRILPHEYNHAVRLFVIPDISRYPDLYDENTPPTEVDFSGYTKKEAEMLHDAYNGLTGYDYYGTGEWVDDDGYERVGIDERDFPALIEKGASNTELRSMLYKEFCTKYGKRPTIDELNRFIDNYSDDELMKLFENLNGYTNYMYNSNEIETSGGNAPLLDPKKIKQALKYVAMEQALPRQELLFGKNGTKLIRKGQDGLDTSDNVKWIRVRGKSTHNYYYVPTRKDENGKYKAIEYDAQGRYFGYSKPTYKSQKHVLSNIPEGEKDIYRSLQDSITQGDVSVVKVGDRNRPARIRKLFQDTFGKEVGNDQYEFVATVAANNGLELDNVARKYFELYELSGRPSIGRSKTMINFALAIQDIFKGKDASVGWNRANINPFTGYIHYLYPYQSITEFGHGFNLSLNEFILQHPGQEEVLTLYITDPSDNLREVNGKYVTGYDDPNHNEYRAHRELEPLMWRYLATDTKDKSFIDFLNRYNSGSLALHPMTYYPDLERVATFKGYVPKIKSDKLVSEAKPVKKGKSGIKIKKKNRGKFTQYCGGTVTQECINRAKRSGNKTLVKRAVFAENARKWNK